MIIDELLWENNCWANSSIHSKTLGGNEKIGIHFRCQDYADSWRRWSKREIASLHSKESCAFVQFSELIHCLQMKKALRLASFLSKSRDSSSSKYREVFMSTFEHIWVSIWAWKSEDDSRHPRCINGYKEMQTVWGTKRSSRSKRRLFEERRMTADSCTSTSRGENLVPIFFGVAKRHYKRNTLRNQETRWACLPEELQFSLKQSQSKHFQLLTALIPVVILLEKTVQIQMITTGYYSSSVAS